MNNNSLVALGGKPEPFAIVLQTPERSMRAARLIAFCMRFKDPANRDAYRQSPQSLYEACGLNALEIRMVEQQDFVAMHAYGVPMVAIGKMQGVMGVPMPELTRLMRAGSQNPVDPTAGAA